MNGQKLKQSLTTITQVIKGDVLIQRLNNMVYVAGTALQFNAVQCFRDDGDDFAVVLTGASAKELVKQIRKAANISLTIDDNFAEFKIEKNTFKHATLDSGSISLRRLLFRFKEEFNFSASGAAFRTAITRSFAFISRDVGDIRFKGAHMTVIDNKLEMMTTDNASLCIYHLPLLTAEKPFKTIVHKDLDFTLKLVLDTIHVGLEEDNLWFKSVSDDGVFTSYVVMKTIFISDESTPMLPYQAKILDVFDEEQEAVSFSVEKGELSEMISDALYYADKAKFNAVKFTLSKADGLVITGGNEVGEGTLTSNTAKGLEKLLVPVEMHLSASSIQKMLSVANLDELTLEKRGIRVKVKLDGLDVFLTTFMI